MLQRSGVALVSLFLAFPAFAQPRPSGSSLDDEFSRFQAEADKELGDFVAAADLDSRAFLDEADAEYKQFVGQVESTWGTFVPSTRPLWSSYSSDRRGHGEADFEKGTVKVQVIVDDAQFVRMDQVAKTASSTIQMMASDKNPAAKNPLAGIVDRGDGKPAQPQELTRIVEQKIATGEIEKKTVVAKDGKKRNAVTVNLTMIANRTGKLAQQYMALVETHAKRFAIDREFILAIMHTESSFNPLAKSSAPAYGLMQLVPTSGAKDAWGLVHGTPQKVDPAELYKPEVNVELGSAYLHLLFHRHFKTMRDVESRTLASISAYNCGPGNTFKALVPLGGTRNSPPADAAAEAVRGALTTRTPEETQNYVRMVSARRDLWRKQLATS